LQKDSQADTILSKANLNNQQVKLTQEDLKEIRATLQEHSTIKTSDFIVPNTLDLKRSEI
jgi:ribosomal protein S13